ncbi:MAG: hypothetical protein DME26_21870 [Verrucomicrobia bacterium]|nr:MAG: hypothetical protein DME26_21870 [Verrucomicrobiota bacterium]
MKTLGANREGPRRVNTRVVTNVFQQLRKKKCLQVGVLARLRARAARAAAILIMAPDRPAG